MKKLVISLVLVVIVVLPLSGCLDLQAGSITGSGKVITREIDFDDFSRVEVGHAFEVEITPSSSYGISITADDNLFNLITVAKSGKTLKIDLKAGYQYHNITHKA